MQSTDVGSSGQVTAAGRLMNVFALTLAVVAIAIAVVLPRLPGPTGPPGPGTLVASHAAIIEMPLNGCTNGNAVTITVPTRGSVVVTSMVRLTIDHFQGMRDMWTARHALSPTVCETSPDALNYIDSVDAGVASDNSYPASGIVETPYQVSPGTYTFYLNVVKLLGIGPGYFDYFQGASTVSVFYPDA